MDAGGNTDSTRMKGMAAVAGALKVKALAKQTSDALQGASGFGSTRIQATIGSQKSQSNSASSTGINQASNIITNNLALIATGAGTDSDITINGSNLDINNDALFKADNDFNVNGVAQNSNTRSINSSSSVAIGGYASFGGQGPSGGITASASRGKGYANSDTTTYANSQINVGGTTTYDIGNDVNIKGGVINTNRAQGKIGGNVNIESLQDTATYDSNQKNAGFTLDVDLVNNGAGSSLSANGGKTDINADYKAVGQQSGIFTGDGGFGLEVEGKTNLIGGAITTTDAAVAAGRNNYISKGGITTQDIENTSSYEGDVIQVGVSLGMTDNKPQANTNGLGYGTDSDSDSSTTKAGITGIAGNSGITTDNQAEYAGALENGFDATRVNEELGAQVEITQAFDQERRKIKTELNQKEQALRDEAEEALENGDRDAWEAYSQEADKIQQKALIFDGISGALYGPNTNGAVGYIAKAISPQIAYQIGQAFKGNDSENSKNGNNELAGVGSPQHLLAHLLLGAAVSYATGNDALTGGLGASAGEATAPLLSQLIYQKPTSELTAEQKDTISSIASLTGVAIGATTDNITDAVNAGETALVAVQENDGRMINGKWCDPGECDSKGNPINRITFSDNEALAIKAVIGTVVWPVGLLEAYLAADNEAEKLAILKTAFSPLKARALLEVLENTQVAKSRANKPSNQTANRAGKTCSFRGDMLVKTISGYRPISEVRIGNMVLSKNEITGKLTYQSVSNHYNNVYNATVYITIKDSNGNTQTIVSNKIHPFFTQVSTGDQLPQSSEGHNYQGNIDNAQWTDASNLKAGYQLLSEDGQWQVVQSVRQTEESLSAYNLTVDNDHTYFVTGSDSTYGVWVHNVCNLGGVVPDSIKKTVNSELVHASDRSVERLGFATKEAAADALRELSARITRDKSFPEGTIIDSSRVDRVLVPFNGGYAVYQVTEKGTAKLKTVLNAK